MSKRSPDTYTNGCSRWTKKVLIAFIDLDGDGLGEDTKDCKR